MIIYTCWLFAESYDAPGGSTEHCYFTLGEFLPGNNVAATISLSYYTEAVTDQNNQLVAGQAGAIVRFWETFNPDGSVQAFNNLDFAGNSENITNCASVTFELTASFSRAWAQANLFTFGPGRRTDGQHEANLVRGVLAYDHASGRIAGAHFTCGSRPQGGTDPLEARLHTSLGDTLPAVRLLHVRGDELSRQSRYRVDPASGKLVEVAAGQPGFSAGAGCAGPIGQ